MTIELNTKLEAQLTQLVQSGKFESIEHFINYSLATLALEDEEHTAWLKTKVQEGIDSLNTE